MGQTASRPTYGSGGYELNLDAEAGEQGGSDSASSSNERTERTESRNDE